MPPLTDVDPTIRPTTRLGRPDIIGPRMPAPSPYETFQKTIYRVVGLIRLHSELHGIQGRPKQHVSDVLRGALVLAVGALDALILESVLSAIPAAARGGDSALLSPSGSRTNPTSISLLLQRKTLSKQSQPFVAPNSAP